MRTLGIFCSLLVAASTLYPSQANPEGSTVPKPTAVQLAWQEAELGVLVCYSKVLLDSNCWNRPSGIPK
jgi:hypothetical protein